MMQQQKHSRTATGGMSSLAAAAARASPRRSSSPVVPTCSFFAKGECRRGNACRFRHELLPSPSDSSYKQKRSTTAAKREDAPMCSFYARGDCRRGEACAFRHEEEKEPVAAAAAAAAAARTNNTSGGSSTPKETARRRSSKSSSTTSKSSNQQQQQHGPEKRWFYGETGWHYGTCHPQPGEWQEHGTARSSSTSSAAATNKSTTTKKKPMMSSLAAAAAAGKKTESSASAAASTSKRTASPKTTNSNALPKRQSSKGSLSNTSSRNGRASPKTAMSNATIRKSRPSTPSSSVSNSRGSPTTPIATTSVSPKLRDLSQKAALSSGAETTTTKNVTQSECKTIISSVQRNKVPLQPLAVRTDENRGENDGQTTNVSPTDSSKSTSNSNVSSSETNVEPSSSAPGSNKTVSQENSKDAESPTGKDKAHMQKEEDLVIKMRTSNESKTQESNSATQTNGKNDGALTTEPTSQEKSKPAVAHKESTTLKEDPVMAMRTTTSPETKTKKMGILPSFSKLKIDTSELVTDSKDLSISRTSTMTEEEDVSPLAATDSSPSNNFNLMKETFEGKKVSTPPTTTPRSSRHPAFAPKKSTLTPPAASTGPSSLARAAAASKQTATLTEKKRSSNLLDSKDLSISRTCTMTEEEDVSPLAATTERRSPSNNFNFIKGTFEGTKVSAAKTPPLHSTTTTPRSSRHPAFAPKKSTLTPPANASTGPSSLARAAAAAAGKQTHTPTAKKSSSSNHTVPYWERLYQDGVKHNKERMIMQSESFDKECTFTPDLRLSTPRSMDGGSRHRRRRRNDANGSSIGKNSQRGRSRKSGSAAVPRVIGGPGTNTEGKGKSGGKEIDENSVLSEHSHRHDNGRRQTFGSTRWRPGSPSLSTANSRGGGRRSLPNQMTQKSKGSPSSLAARAAAGKNSAKQSKGNTSPTTNAKGGRPFPNNRWSKADNAAFRAPRGPSPKSTGSAIHKTAGASPRPKLVSPSDLNAKEPIGDIYGKRSVKSLAARFEGASGKDSSPKAVPTWGKGGAASSGSPRGNNEKRESHGDGGGIKKVWTKEKISPLRHRWGSDSDSD